MYRKILVAVDGSAAAERGFREAVRLAKAHKAKLVILHVVDEHVAFLNLGSGATRDLVRAMIREGEKRLAGPLARAKRAGVDARAVLSEKVDGGSAAYEILRQAKKLRADLIVLGTHGRRGIRRLILGSDAELVVRGAPVPVLLVRGEK